MEETNIEDFAKNIKDYAKVQADLVELQLIEKTAAAGSNMISRLVIASVIFVSVLFLSLALAFYLYELLRNLVLSFVIIGAFYAVIALLFALFRKPLFVYPIRNNIIHGLIKNNS
jgi:hypothetical protein